MPARRSFPSPAGRSRAHPLFLSTPQLNLVEVSSVYIYRPPFLLSASECSCARTRIAHLFVILHLIHSSFRTAAHCDLRSLSSISSDPQSRKASQTLRMSAAHPNTKTPTINVAEASDQEKHTDLIGSDASYTVTSPQFDNAATKRLLRKLDRHLIPILALMYLHVVQFY